MAGANLGGSDAAHRIEPDNLFLLGLPMWQPLTVDMAVEFYRHGEKKTDRWSFTPDQLAVLQKAKDKAKEVGL